VRSPNALDPDGRATPHQGKNAITKLKCQRPPLATTARAMPVLRNGISGGLGDSRRIMMGV